MLCCYNRVSNNPYKAHHHPQATPLAKVDDTAIKAVGLTTAGAARAFYRAEDDRTVEVST